MKGERRACVTVMPCVNSVVIIDYCFSLVNEYCVYYTSVAMKATQSSDKCSANFIYMQFIYKNILLFFLFFLP